jgi:hypothetical protein
VSRVGIDHVGEPEGRSRVAEAGPGSTNPNAARVGEPGGNRTHNPQIKSLLLCQLSYRPEGNAWRARRAQIAPRQNPILP